jgi:hypothetical protein
LNPVPLASASIVPNTSSRSEADMMKKSSSEPFHTEAILAQVWDISESPMFATSLIEVTDACFRIVFEQLRSNIFAPDHSMMKGSQKTWTPMRTPPLASILPHIKSIASELLPTNSQQLTVNIQDLVSGPILDSLCLSVFDATPAK